MVSARPRRDRHRPARPRPHPGRQPRPAGQRDPRQADPVPDRARPRDPHAESPPRARPQARPGPPAQAPVALHRQPQVDPVAVQTALIGHTIARLGSPRWLALAVDWTMFDTILPGGGRTQGRRVRYQVLRIAVPRRGRALPLLEVADDRDHLPADHSQNQLEEQALAAVLAALPQGIRPVILADRGFARATLLEWLQARRVDFVVRIDRGTCITEPDGRRWKLGHEQLARGQLAFAPGVRYGRYHGRPRDLVINLALSWRVPPGHCRDRRRKPLMSRGTWRQACRTRTAQRRGTGNEAGSSSPSKTARAASALTECRSPAPAAVAAAGRVGHRAGVADPAGLAGARLPAARLARARRPARPTQPDHSRPGLARSPARPPTRLPAPPLRRRWVCVRPVHPLDNRPRTLTTRH